GRWRAERSRLYGRRTPDTDPPVALACAGRNRAPGGGLRRLQPGEWQAQAAAPGDDDGHLLLRARHHARPGAYAQGRRPAVELARMARRHPLDVGQGRRVPPAAARLSGFLQGRLPSLGAQQSGSATCRARGIRWRPASGLKRIPDQTPTIARSLSGLFVLRDFTGLNLAESSSHRLRSARESPPSEYARHPDRPGPESPADRAATVAARSRSEEHTSELRHVKSSYAVFGLRK